MDDVLRLLLNLLIFEVIFRTNERHMRTAWLGMTDEVAPLVVCPHPTLAAGHLKSPCCEQQHSGADRGAARYLQRGGSRRARSALATSSPISSLVRFLIL